MVRNRTLVSLFVTQDSWTPPVSPGWSLGVGPAVIVTFNPPLSTGTHRQSGTHGKAISPCSRRDFGYSPDRAPVRSNLMPVGRTLSPKPHKQTVRYEKTAEERASLSEIIKSSRDSHLAGVAFGLRLRISSFKISGGPELKSILSADQRPKYHRGHLEALQIQYPIPDIL